jgi:hypothetical protein
MYWVRESLMTTTGRQSVTGDRMVVDELSGIGASFFSSRDSGGFGERVLANMGDKGR